MQPVMKDGSCIQCHSTGKKKTLIFPFPTTYLMFPALLGLIDKVHIFNIYNVVF